MIPLTRTIPHRISGLLLLSSIFILHNVYRIHLHRLEKIPLTSYIATYPLPLTQTLHQTLRTRYKTVNFRIHLYTVPLWTLLAIHQILPRRLTRRTHNTLGRCLLVCSTILSASATGILGERRVENGWITFRNGSWLFIGYWFVCFLGLRSRKHAFWGVQLVSVGFGTALLRVCVFLWLWGSGGVVDEERYEDVLGCAMCVAVLVNPFLVWLFWGVRFSPIRKIAS